MMTPTSPVLTANTAVEIVIFKFHTKPTSFTDPNNFQIDPEDLVKNPGVTTKRDVVIQQVFKERNRISIVQE